MKIKKEKTGLLEEIQQYLPIPAYPSKELSELLRKKGKDIDINTELKITTVLDSGDVGGIVCSILEENREVFVVSLTHLRVKPDHPLRYKILAYQKQRIKSLRNQNSIHRGKHRLS